MMEVIIYNTERKIWGVAAQCVVSYKYLSSCLMFFSVDWVHIFAALDRLIED